MPNGSRIEGWKRIAAYFGRDESTVKRWEATRGLPVRRLPGVRSQVYAFSGDLEEWRIADDAQQQEPVSPATRHRAGVTLSLKHPALPTWLGLACAGAVAVAGIFWWSTPAANSTRVDADARELYESGNFALEQRTPRSIRKALVDFSVASARDPRFAAAYSGIADSWLLIREYSNVTDEEAYPRAEAAARAALAVNANDPAAHRALAFVRFWWNGDVRGAQTEFRRAIQLAPDDARTHHWFANMLDNSGSPGDALKEIEKAHALSPGSPSVEVDRIRILTEHDPVAERKALDDFLALQPQNRSAMTYLAALDFVQGRERDYFEVARREATSRNDARSLARIDRFEKAFNQGGREGLIAAMRREFERAYHATPSPDPRILALQATWPGR